MMRLEDRNVYILILAHENEDVLAEQVKNIRHFIPNAGIILYNGGTNQDFAKSLDLPICPYSRPVNWGQSSRVLWDGMRWLEETDVRYNYLVYFDHDMLLVKHGFEDFLIETMKGYDCMGWQLIKGDDVQKFPAPSMAKALWKEWETWEPIFQTDAFLRYFNPGQVYHKKIIKRMLKRLRALGDEKVNELLEKTKVHALEEMFYVTLALGCGGKCREYPDGKKYNEAVRWGKNLRTREVKKAINHPSYYWIHPIKGKKLIQMNKWLYSHKADPSTITTKNTESRKLTKDERRLIRKAEKQKRRMEKKVRKANGCKCHDYQNQMMDSKTVLGCLKQAVANKGSFSLTRFSHAEMSYLQWDINPSLIKDYDRFREYSGMTGSIEEVAGKLAYSMEDTDIVGLIPVDCKDNGNWWYPTTKNYLHHVDRIPEKICSVWVSQEWVFMEEFWEVLKQNRVALIGRRAEVAAPHFIEKGVQITEVKNLEGIDEIDSVYKFMRRSNAWDLALISAAIPATILTPILAKDTGRIVIDFGHAMDMVIEGDQYDFYKYFDEWKEKKE